MLERECINCAHHFVCKYDKEIRAFINNFHYDVSSTIQYWGDTLAEHCSQYMERE